MNEINGLHIAVLIISGLSVLLILLWILRSGNTATENKIRRGEKQSGNEAARGRPCPLCGERLNAGEKVHSVLYPGKPDSLMEIHGCPHCENGGNRRICPVCKKSMPDGSVLIARVFEKPGKKHVHVLGCTGCYSGRSVPKKSEQ